MNRISRALLVCAALVLPAAAYADDVNRTGQTQSVEPGKSGTASQGGNADTMGGGNTSSTSPAEAPQKAPANGTQPDQDKSKTNSEPDSAGAGKN
jgi:hypothetical protein